MGVLFGIFFGVGVSAAICGIIFDIREKKLSDELRSTKTDAQCLSIQLDWWKFKCGQLESRCKEAKAILGGEEEE